MAESTMPMAARSVAALSPGDVERVRAAINSSSAPNTRKNYRSQWAMFERWAAARQVDALPADPELVAAYLAELAATHKLASVGVARAAIGKAHELAGLENPTTRPIVRQTMRGIARQIGGPQHQARPLDRPALAAIVATAMKPRLSYGRVLETDGRAELRGLVDIALARTMFDGLLRISEAAALVWADISRHPDGTGRLTVRRSKTDPEGAGAVLYLSGETMAALDAIRPGDSEDSDSVRQGASSIFGLSAGHMATRINQAARAAGLGDGFTGHSPRVGMALELARANIELPAIMQAGRWQSPDMPARYIRNESAGRGAVARLYRRR